MEEKNGNDRGALGGLYHLLFKSNRPKWNNTFGKNLVGKKIGGENRKIG